MITFLDTRFIGLRDRKSYTKPTERYSRKRLDETHCISEMYNPLILETTHAEQIMSWEKQEHILLCQVTTLVMNIDL
jgi:hypothetical protein